MTDLYDRVYQWTVDRLIGDRCPCDRCSSDVKMRAFYLLMLSLFGPMGISAALPFDRRLTTAAFFGGIALVWIALRPVFDAINDEMPAVCPNTGEIVDPELAATGGDQDR